MAASRASASTRSLSGSPLWPLTQRQVTVCRAAAAGLAALAHQPFRTLAAAISQTTGHPAPDPEAWGADDESTLAHWLSALPRPAGEKVCLVCLDALDPGALTNDGPWRAHWPRLGALLPAGGRWALLLAVNKWHIVLTRSGYRVSLMPLFAILALYGLARGLRRVLPVRQVRPAFPLQAWKPLPSARSLYGSTHRRGKATSA